MNKFLETLLFMLFITIVSNLFGIIVYKQFEFFYFLGTLLPTPFLSIFYYKYILKN